MTMTSVSLGVPHLRPPDRRRQAIKVPFSGVLSDLLPGFVNRPPDLGEKLRRPTGLRQGPGKVTLPPGFDRWLPT